MIDKYKLLIVTAIAITVFFSLSPVAAAEIASGSKIFQVNCAGCHANGGNIVRWGKNLKQRALRRNKVDSLPAVVWLVTHGKNNMPAYGDRLSDEQIETVSAYVLERAAENWH